LEERVNLSFLSNEDYCRAVISPTGETPVSNDFAVCGLKEVGNFGCIDKGHEGDSVLRLDCGEEDFLLVIQRPGIGLNDSVAFSRPGLRASELVRFLGAGHGSRWESVVCCYLPPRVWKVLLEHFGCCLSAPSSGHAKRDHPPTPVRTDTNNLNSSPPIRQKSKRRAVHDHNGLDSIAKPIQSPPCRGNDTGPTLTPLGRASGSSTSGSAPATRSTAKPTAPKDSGSAKTPIQVEEGSDEEFVDASEGLEEEAKEEMFPPEERGGNALRGRQVAKEKASASRHRSKSADSNASANQSRKVPSRRQSVSPARGVWSSVASVKKTGFAYLVST
jgi:hypothetical protein